MAAGRPEQQRERSVGGTADQLRRQAEERLAELSASPSPLAPEDVAGVVHELQVHQIELEMQNDELRRAQLDLDAQREKYFELFDLAPVGYLILDDMSVIADANLTAAHLLGVERRLLIGQPLTSLIFSPDRDVYYLLKRALERTHLPQTADIRLCRIGADESFPSHYWSLLEARPVGGGEQPLTMWVTFTDVDERVAARETLRESAAMVTALNEQLEERIVTRTAELEATNRELESFAYSVSHDLRAPLRTIDGFSQMVMEDAGANLTGADVEHLRRVRAASQRIASLIDDLLGLSRIASKDMLRDEVDLGALSLEVLAELREQQPDRQIEIVVASGMQASADSALLRVILFNLLDNAWKFTSKHERARIEVGVTHSDGERAFFVRDDGAGFDPQYATHLFGAFQRMHQAGEFEGDGIGLATVQRLVTRHGGRVWAEAEVERGATFFFTLPERVGQETRA